MLTYIVLYVYTDTCDVSSVVPGGISKVWKRNTDHLHKTHDVNFIARL